VAAADTRYWQHFVIKQCDINYVLSKINIVCDTKSVTYKRLEIMQKMQVTTIWSAANAGSATMSADV